MSLTLEVIGAKAARMGGAARRTFTAGGTIGRLADNDWVLPDEYISGHHARISLLNGDFLIEDTSTNGVFINSQQNRLTRNKPYPLRSGDTLFIDDYEVRVTVSTEPAVEIRAPARSGAYSGSLIPDDPLFDDALGAGGVANSLDPLALLGLQSPPPPAPGPSVASLQNNSPLSQHYRPPTPAPAPTPVPPPGVIPDDYDPMGADDPFASPPPAPMARPSPGVPPAFRRAPSQPVAHPTSANPSANSPTPARPVASPPPSAHAPTIVTGPLRMQKPAVSPAAAEPSGVTPVARREGDVIGTAPRPTATPAPSRAGAVAAAADLDFAAMLEAAGIDAARITPELSQQFGMILRVVVAGLMDVLRARDKIKDEFRMRMTTFKPADNNPLKFSANVEDALHNLLVKRNAAYLGPVEAFEDAFLDVRNHQMAMLAGVRVAYEAMLQEFDPEALQRQFDPQAKGTNFLNGGPKAKYWELYRHWFHDMVKDADSSFRRLFGDDFAKAYEEQLSRLRAANRAERK